MDYKYITVLRNFVDVEHGSYTVGQHVKMDEVTANKWIEGNLVADCPDTHETKEVKVTKTSKKKV